MIVGMYPNGLETILGKIFWDLQNVPKNAAVHNFLTSGRIFMKIGMYPKGLETILGKIFWDVKNEEFSTDVYNVHNLRGFLING
jgi:hypothetical protein